MDEFAVLVFRDQVLDESQQMAFTRALGPVDMGLLKVLQRRSRFKEAGMIDVSNVDLESNILARDDPRLITMLANQLWHSDSSFKQPSAKYSLLLACILPEQGGETEFADMRAAYEALPDEVRVEVEGLVAEHSAFHSRMQLGDRQYTPKDLAKYPERGMARRPYSSGLPAEDALYRGACHAHCRTARPGRAAPARRAFRACDATSVCVPPYLASGRSGHLGQSRRAASRPPLRSFPAA